MNPLIIFKALRDISALIERANALAGPDKRWSLVYGNRSFVLSVVGVLAALAVAFGLPFPLPVDVTGDTVYALITVGAFIWAGIERIMGKTRAVWSRKQAVQAITEADALDTALRKAGAK